MWGLFFDIMILMSPNYGLKELRCSVGVWRIYIPRISFRESIMFTCMRSIFGRKSFGPIIPHTPLSDKFLL